MAQYNMTNQIKEIAELRGKGIKEVAKELKIEFNETELKKIDDKWTRVEIADSDLEFIAWNRREENKVIGALEDAKKEVKQKEINEKRFSTYRWVKENGEWVVAGSFTGKQIGDKITVVKASGNENLKEIVSFTEAGNAIVK